MSEAPRSDNFGSRPPRRAPRVVPDLEAFGALIGQEIGVSDWHTISQERVLRFAEVTEDRQWIHTDPHRAASGPFGVPVAHGYLTLSLIPRMAADVFRIGGVAMVVNYGLNRVRFPQAVRVESRVRDRVRLVSLSPTQRGILAVIEHRIDIEDQQRPACVAETVSLLIPEVSAHPTKG